MVWIEPDYPRNPLLGIVEALALAGGRPVLVCPADLPFITPALLRALAASPEDDAPAIVASVDGVIRPLVGCYRPHAAALLAGASQAHGRRSPGRRGRARGRNRDRTMLLGGSRRD